MPNKERFPEYKLWEKVIYFFPVQLFFVHLKKNLLLLIFWLILFAIISKVLLLKYGVPYLFLYPEYLGSVNFLSHLIVGLLTGSFIMAFNISSYVVNGFRFPFLATLNRPFVKYCQNNLIIPLGYSLFYIYSLIQFQREFEHVEYLDIAQNVLGFLTGNILFIGVTIFYFNLTNKNVDHYLEKDEQNGNNRVFLNPVKQLLSSKKKWDQQAKSKKEWKVTAYITNWGRIAVARDSSHYSRTMLEKVFSQNRINATFFQVLVVAALFVLGLFHETSWLAIPASGSVLLFFTVLVMLASAFYSWFKGWTNIALIAAFIVANQISIWQPVSYQNQAYGLNYDTASAPYSQEIIMNLQENEQNLYLDVENGLTLLQNWKARTGEEKPVAVFLNVPGGGLRSAMWTIRSISYANEENKGELWNNLLLISGSSGGMIGAAYLREFYYRQQHGESIITIDSILNDIGEDKLNTVAASAVMNDLFFRFKRFDYGDFHYTKDRARAFEKKLNLDTRGWLDRKLSDYNSLELSAEMPLLVLSPTISNDGRKLIISSQPVAYLCHNNDSNQMNENIEFRRFFDNYGADDLSFLSALRMSATFPYVFPAATLPTDPSIEILDAGIRDNYGISNTLKFIFFFREWLAANTSKVIIVQVRDQKKFNDLKRKRSTGFLDGITQPFGTFYSTILDVQDYQMDDQIRLAKEWYEGEINLVDFVLDRSESNPISLSWHLTEREKGSIMRAIDTDYNTVELIRLKRLFKPSADK